MNWGLEATALGEAGSNSMQDKVAAASARRGRRSGRILSRRDGGLRRSGTAGVGSERSAKARGSSADEDRRELGRREEEVVDTWGEGEAAIKEISWAVGDRGVCV
mmetsp:Transcript_31950/g.77844  ORF Transcript_31950/g.77844 Transcript_31950/m.77844 type:complete len:105 (-) Transcript_31950:65-379(-)